MLLFEIDIEVSSILYLYIAPYTKLGASPTAINKYNTHVVSIFIADSCVIKQGVTELESPNYCHFERLMTKFIFLHD